MRYVYSVVRFVPDVGRGEQVNIAVVVGSEEGWRTVLSERLERARAIVAPGDEDLVDHALRVVDSIGSSLAEDGEELLRRRAASYMSFVQLSEPAPVAAASLDEAVALITAELL